MLGALLLLAMGLWCWSFCRLPETRAQSLVPTRLMDTLVCMLQDPRIWRSALWIALFNIALFSYYSLAPFMFKRIGLSQASFGYSGVLLALGSALGTWLNQRLLRLGLSTLQLIRLASVTGLLGGIGVWMSATTAMFVLPMLLVVLAFGMAIPNVLGSALSDYTDRLGTAGALLGLLYYLLIGSGLLLAGWMQALGQTLMLCFTLALLLTLRKPWNRKCT